MPLADFAAAYEKIKQAGSVIGPSLRAKRSNPFRREDAWIASSLRSALLRAEITPPAAGASRKCNR
jgi:hypothetical protein